MTKEMPAELIGLDKTYAKRLSEMFNIYLANLHVVYVKLHNFHWNVVGVDFIDFHEKTEELYKEVAEEIDEVAERIRMLGLFPLASMQEYINHATLQEAESEPYNTATISYAIVEDFSATARFLRDIGKLAEGQGDEHTIRILEDAYAFLEKYVWFFSAYLKTMSY